MVASNYYLLCKQAYTMIYTLVKEDGRIAEAKLLHSITMETGVGLKKLKQMLDMYIAAQILVRADGFIALKGYKEEVVESGIHY